MTGLIYKYTNKINNKIYIGQTRTKLETRHYKHLTQLEDGTYFHRALKKYGEDNFDLEIIEDNIPLEKLDEREIYWIKYFDSYFTAGKGYIKFPAFHSTFGIISLLYHFLFLHLFYGL